MREMRMRSLRYGAFEMVQQRNGKLSLQGWRYWAIVRSLRNRLLRNRSNWMQRKVIYAIRTMAPVYVHPLPQGRTARIVERIRGDTKIMLDARHAIVHLLAAKIPNVINLRGPVPARRAMKGINVTAVVSGTMGTLTARDVSVIPQEQKRKNVAGACVVVKKMGAVDARRMSKVNCATNAKTKLTV
ncbi:unnamed protein product [Acanthoscelides obtectus]|uniref:Uncharacterized protein n=1 Tax=Acanthoscelides obtectus TaxID=200917 RepID=A0A9P0KRT6_ACAOB|nr:unnamed protein product [Acanthoscelides obtectus]CAK1670227.1 hypothetical protein AOBTE_LOCUS27494 [Acanthoscelides obtectus]